MGVKVKGILYELYDYLFTYLLYRPDDKRAVVLVEDALYAMQNPKRPRLKIFPNDLGKGAILVVLPFWIYPSKHLLTRAEKILEIDSKTTLKIFRYAEAYPTKKLDKYCIFKMRQLAKENVKGILEIIDSAELI